MKPVKNYLKNVVQSLKYATITHVKEIAPTSSSFIESNQELYKEAYHDIRDYKTTYSRMKTYIQNSDMYKVSDQIFTNAIEDIKSGKFYNQEREDAEAEKMFGFDMDFDSDTGTAKISSSESAGETKATISAIADNSLKNASMVTEAVASSAQYVTGVSKSIANMQFVQTAKLTATMEAGFKGIHSGIDDLRRFNSEAMTTHITNSQKFFEHTTKALDEQNAMLKEMLEMQRNVYGKKLEAEKSSGNKRLGFDDILGGSGFDIKQYMQAVKGNFGDALYNTPFGMLSMLSPDMLKMLAGNPMAFVADSVISTIMGPKLNTSIKRLDKSINGAFATFIARLNKQAKDASWNDPFTGFFSTLFGLKNDVKTTINTGNFNKGAMPFDGETKKSIVEIIPAYLRRIEAALTGKEERLYDSRQGKWVTASEVKKNFKQLKQGYVDDANSEVSSEMNKMLELIKFNSEEQRKEMTEGMQKAFKEIFNDYGVYDPKEKKASEKYKENGFKTKEQQELFDLMFEKLSKETKMGLASRTGSSRSSLNRQMEDFEKNGSVYSNLFDNSEFGKKLSSNLSLMDLSKAHDKLNNTVFDYLREIKDTLIDIRDIGGMGGRGPSLAPSGGPIEGIGSDQYWNSIHTGRNLGKTSPKAKQDTTRSSYKSWNSSEPVANYGDNKAIGKALDEYSTKRDKERYKSEIRESEGFINTGIRESKEQYKARKDIRESLTGVKSKGLMEELSNATSLSEKYNVIISHIYDLTSKPGEFLAGIVDKADKHIYDFFFSKDTNLRDKNGKPISGFFNRMVYEMNNSLDKVTNYFTEHIIKPFEKRFNAENMWGATKNAMKEFLGFDFDKVKQDAKDFFSPIGKGIKNTFKDTFHGIGNAFTSVGKDVGDKINPNDVQKHSKGGYIKKTGLAVVSKGEKIIPADENIDNPDMDTVDTDKQAKEEESIRSKFLKYANGNIGSFAKGTENEDSKFTVNKFMGKGKKVVNKAKNTFSQGIDSIEGFITSLAGDKAPQVQEAINKTNKYVKQYAPQAAGGAAVGGVLGTFLGGPLVGALLGSAINVTRNSQEFQEFLFGKEIVDENGNKSRKGGLLGGNALKAINKYLPDMKNYGIVGTAAGVITGLGPIGGAILGSAIGFAKNSESVQSLLFGDKEHGMNNGIFSKKSAKFIKKALPHMVPAVLATVIAGPFGLLGNTLLGSSIGMLSATDEFKNAMLGKPDAKGNRTGGLIGAIKGAVINPLAKLGSGIQSHLVNYIQKDLLGPIARAAVPIGRQLTIGAKDTFGLIKKGFDKLGEKTLGVPLSKLMKETFMSALAGPFGINKKIAKGALWVGRNGLAMPSKLIGKVGDRLRKHQIEKGNADYMSASERLQWMHEHGKDTYDLSHYDTQLASSDTDQLSQLQTALASMTKNDATIKAKMDAATTELGHGIADSKINWETSRKIVKLAQRGDVKGALEIIQKSKIPNAEKQKLFDLVTKSSAKWREINASKNKYQGLSEETFAKLQKDFGMKGINSGNIDKWVSNIDTELDARKAKESENTPENSPDKIITQSMDANTGIIAGKLDEINTVLKAIATGDFKGLSKEQMEKAMLSQSEKELLSNQEKLGDAAKFGMLDASQKKGNKRKDIIANMYAKAGHQQDIGVDNDAFNTLIDNKDRFNDIHSLAKNNNVFFEDVDQILKYDDKTANRFISLGELGYNIKKDEYEKIANYSEDAFKKVLLAAQLGLRLEDMDYLIDKDEETIQRIAELHNFGYQEFMSNKEMGSLSNRSFELTKGEHAQEYMAMLKDRFKNRKRTKAEEADMGAKVGKAGKQGFLSRTLGNIKDTVHEKYANAYNSLSGNLALHNGINIGYKESPTENSGFNALASQMAMNGELGTGVAANGGTIWNSILDKLTGILNISKEELNNNIAQAQKQDEKDKTTVTINPATGQPMTFIKSNDGSAIAADKDTRDELIKAEQRSEDQHGIFESLKSMAGSAKDKAKKGLKKGKEVAKGGLLGLLGGLFSLVKLPLTLLKSLGGLINFIPSLLGFGGVLPKLGGKLLNLGGSALKYLGGKGLQGLGWAGGKIGGLAGKGIDKLANSTLGKKFLNSKVGGFLGKAGSKVGGLFGKAGRALGGLLGSAVGGGDVDANGNPVESSNDPAEAINITRVTLSSYLQRIVELLENGAGPDGATGALEDLANNLPGGRRTRNGRTITRGPKGRTGRSLPSTRAGSRPVTSGGGLFGKIGGFLGRNKMAAFGAAMLGHDLLTGQGNRDEVTENDTMGHFGFDNLQVGMDTDDRMIKEGQEFLNKGASGAANNPELIQGIMTKCRDGLSAIGKKLQGFPMPKGMGEKMGKFFAKIMEKVSSPTNLGKMAAKAAVKMGFTTAEAAGGGATLGLGAVVIGAAETGFWLAKGVSNVRENFGLKAGAEPTMGMRVISAVAEAVTGMLPIGYVLDPNDIINIAMTVFGGIAGITPEDIRKANEGADPNAKPKSTWERITDSASSMWNSAKEAAGNVSDAFKSAGNWIYNKASAGVNWLKSKYMDNPTESTGTGKYGRGYLGGAFQSQIDPRNAMGFNAGYDTEQQTMYDSGCGPVSAVNMASALGVTPNAKDAAAYALGKGYKEKNGGTEPGFFGDYLGKYGINTKNVSGTGIMNSLKDGNPVVLMGRDGKGTSDKTPYGQYNHYVTATGLDKNGNMIIQDPESNTPDLTYKASDVISKTSMGIAGGKGKFGRGSRLINRAINHINGKGKWGQGGSGPEYIYNALIKKGFSSNAAAGIVGNMIQESGCDPTKVQGGGSAPEVTVDDETGYGLCQWTTASRQQNLANYARSKGTSSSDADTQIEFMMQEMGDENINAMNQQQSPEDAAKYFHDSFERSADSASGIQHRADLARQAFQTQGKGMDVAGTYKGGASNNGSKSSGKDYSGIFGKLEKLRDAFNIFDIGTAKASGNQKPFSSQQTVAEQQNAKIPDLLKKLKSGEIGVDDYIQQCDNNPDNTKEQIQKSLEDNGFWDADTQKWFTDYFSKKDAADHDDRFNKLCDDVRAGILAPTDFIPKADALDIVPRNSIKEFLCSEKNSDGSFKYWDDQIKEFYDKYYDKKDGNYVSETDQQQAMGKYGLGKYGRGRATLADAEQQMSDSTPSTDTNSTPSVPTPATPTNTSTGDSSDGVFDSVISKATAMSNRVKSAIAPIMGRLGSMAGKMFGSNTIKKIFGNSNPFDSIFSSQKSGNSGNSTGGNNSNGGTFISHSSDAGIKKASDWAEQYSNSGEEGYGNNGCTTFAQEYLKQAGNPFDARMSLDTEALKTQAQESGMWKTSNQPGSEGDIALLDTEQYSPGHAVIYDGQGGCWGNSSSRNKILHYPNMLSSFPAGLNGYVATGAGEGSVATSNGEQRSSAEAQGDATLDAAGKYGRSKFGLGIVENIKGRTDKYGIQDPMSVMTAKSLNMKVDKYSNSLDAMAKKKGTGKYGKGDIPWYNQASDDDDLLVQQAKAQELWGNRKISDVTAANTIDPNAINAANNRTSIIAQQQQSAQQVPQTQVVDNSEKLDKMIELLSGIGTALTVIAKAVTGGANMTGATDVNTTDMLQKAFTGAQNSGFSDLFAGKDTNSIVSAMTALAQR